MEHVIIRDVHGEDFWKKIVNQELLAGDKVKFIFIGDFFDSSHVKAEQQILNFLDVMKLCEMYDVTVLDGNHDFSQYVYDSTCAGFQELYQHQIKEVLKANKDKFQLAHSVVQNDVEYLITHAGVSTTWCKSKDIDYSNLDKLVETLNDLWIYSPYNFFHVNGAGFGYGDDPRQGPLWIRPRSLITSMVPYNQIVGHTFQKEVVVKTSPKNQKKLYLTDTPSCTEYIVIKEDGEVEIRSY